MFCSSNWNRL
uniref:Uncharacterized protein n=1 Tax=Arundo donax TaxID=35708 RepID=A0A0A9FK41_ARUDO